MKVDRKLAGADGRDEILQEGAKKGEGDTINSDGDEKDDDEQQRHNNNSSNSNSQASSHTSYNNTNTHRSWGQ